MKVAIVQAMCGHVTCVGPNDFKAAEHNDAMDAATSFHLEAGYLPVACYWIEADLPPIPDVPTVRAQVVLDELEAGR